MSFDIDKAALTRRIAVGYQRLAGLIDHLSPVQMEQPGAFGSLSIKNLLAHLIAHEQRALEELRAAQRGWQLPIDHAANDAFNAGAVAAVTPIDPSSVRVAWERSVQQVLAAIHVLDDADFQPTSALTQILEDSIDGAIGNNTYEHYAEHWPEVVAWIERLSSAASITNEEEQMMAEESSLEQQLEEQQRLVQWLQKELERQRKQNSELRKAVAELARTFQASLAEAYYAGEQGDIQRVREVTRTNQANWQHYLEQIIAASSQEPRTENGEPRT